MMLLKVTVAIEINFKHGAEKYSKAIRTFMCDWGLMMSLYCVLKVEPIWLFWLSDCLLKFSLPIVFVCVAASSNLSQIPGCFFWVLYFEL